METLGKALEARPGEGGEERGRREGDGCRPQGSGEQQGHRLQPERARPRPHFLQADTRLPPRVTGVGIVHVPWGRAPPPAVFVSLGVSVCVVWCLWVCLRGLRWCVARHVCPSVSFPCGWRASVLHDVGFGEGEGLRLLILLRVGLGGHLLCHEISVCRCARCFV